jgi:hypothetical protein
VAKKEFVITVLETDGHVGRAMMAKCDSVARLIDAFHIVAEDLGKQVGLQPLMQSQPFPDDLGLKGAAAGAEVKRR